MHTELDVHAKEELIDLVKDLSYEKLIKLNIFLAGLEAGREINHDQEGNQNPTEHTGLQREDPSDFTAVAGAGTLQRQVI